MRPLLLSILVAGLLLPAAALAQPASPSDADRVTARALARQGHEAQTRGQYAEAADAFRRADALVHAPTLELGLARADVGLGKLVAAHEIYRRIAHEELAPGAPAPFVKAIASAKDELAALEPRLAWVTIAVQGPSADAVTVTLDDAPFSSAALGTRRASDPGSHRVRATAPGFAAAESSFVLKEGQSASVALAPRRLAEPVAVVAPAAAAPPPGVSSPGVAPARGTSASPAASAAASPAASVAASPAAPVAAVTEAPPLAAPATGTPFAKTFGVVTIGLGVAGLATGGVLGVLALNKHDALAGGCPGGHCAADQSDQVSQYNALATASTVCIIASGAAVVGGLTLVLTAPKSSTVTAYAGFPGAGITGSW